MQISLDQQVALITGASSGIGAEAAKALAGAGAGAGAAEQELLKTIPYGRIGDVEDIANAVVFLAADVSDYIVGTTLFIDGGMSLYPEFRGNG